MKPIKIYLEREVDTFLNDVVIQRMAWNRRLFIKYFVRVSIRERFVNVIVA